MTQQGLSTVTVLSTEPLTQPAPTQSELPSASSEAMQQRLKLLGSITWLMFHSPLYRAYSIAMLEARVLPSLMHNQFRYYEMQGQPIGFLNWCWLSPEIEAQFETGQYQLSPNEWKSGDRLWFPEFIAPFGHAKTMVKDIRKNILPKGTPAKALRVRADGTLRAIAHYKL